MLTIARLFGKSPFAPLLDHMKKVRACIHELPKLFDAFSNQDFDQVLLLAKKISKLEHEADLTKNDIRNHLPKSLFLPIDRGNLLEILHLQDSLADKAEDIGVSLTLQPLEQLPDMQEDFSTFCNENLIAFEMVEEVIRELDSLLETSFGGIEAEKVKGFIDKIAKKEHEIDRLQYHLIKKLYSYGDQLPYPKFHLWMTLIKEVGTLSNLAEKLGNRIRMTLELK